MNWYLAVLKNYIGFSGRARRTEYWMYTLINTLILFLLMTIGTIGGLNDMPFLSMIYPIYAFAVLLPSLAVAVRRLHDTGKSGWSLLLGLIPLAGPIILIVFMVTGSDDANEYGERAPATP
ncbi:MAG TPA: DUF805 domain-containing protein [Candidatus Stackebrandtia excrementipullorum]|nr:DUF805 domain-containing protein [Candidatus Stackebrandtia excrementipullorum]